MELYSVIKNEGATGLLFWCHRKEDFRTGSQLIVSENEDALFCRDGVIYEVFSGGKYTLQTANYPFIDNLRSMFSGGAGAFSCKIYFVNKSDALELKWGTDSPIQVRDPLYGISTQIVSRGSYTIRVVDSKKFVLKFVGNNFQAVTAEAIRSRFRSVIIQTIKTAIATAVKSSKEEILGLSSRLEEFAGVIAPRIAPVLDEYGVELVNFYVSAVDIPENDPGRVKLEEAIAQRAQLNILGNDWQRVQARDIMMATATNDAVPGVGACLGMGLGAMGSFGSLVNQTAAPAVMGGAPAGTPQNDNAECPQCHNKITPGAKFCPNCGTKMHVIIFCPECGKSVTVGAKFCAECGHAL